MRRSILLSCLILFVFCTLSEAQNRRRPAAAAPKAINKNTAENIRTAIVVDERLAVLRMQPSLNAKSVQRMRSGRFLTINGSKISDGILFYRVNVPPANYGWVQAEAVIAKNRAADEQRLFRLVQASEGFDQIEKAMLFLENFPNSALRAPILLLLGDLAEENALKLSTEATRRLDRREMTASGAPVHSFYLNYAGLDRFIKIGINFVFNSASKRFYYEGAAWREITAKFPNTTEAAEAQKRLDNLAQKMRETAKP